MFAREVIVSNALQKVVCVCYDDTKIIFKNDSFRLIMDDKERVSSEAISDTLKSLSDEKFIDNVKRAFALTSPTPGDIKSIFKSFDITYK